MGKTRWLVSHTSHLGEMATLRSLLAAYAKVLFSRSPLVGALVLLATLTVPAAGVAGFVAASAANCAALALGLEADAVEDGSYAYNAILLGLGVSQSFAVGHAAMLAMAIVGAAGCVLVTAALRSALGGITSLPVLSAPFLLGFCGLLGAASWLGIERAPHAIDPWAALPVPAAIALFVKSLGALFFLPRLDAGALVLLALLVHSRIATLLGAAAFALTAGLALRLGVSLDEAAVQGIGLNAALAAIGLGAVWFVPSAPSFAVGMLGAALSTAAFLGLAAPLGRVGLPPSILPFHVAVFAALLAMRRRSLDDRPKSVDFLPGTPEENLAYYRTHRARFASLYPVVFRLPFRGTWTCTQGVDGAFTHQGPWRHAFDFQVMGEDGRAFRDEGKAVSDYHCYRLPVLAAAAGTVVKVQSSVPESDVGDVNVEQNWGNYVVVCHAAGLYSVVAHLCPGSIKVAEGQIVAEGDVLGLAGSSGRSPEPHLHFQLQGSADLGSPTLPCRFGDVVVRNETGALRAERALVPAEGEALRNLEIDEDIAAHLAFPPGRDMAFRLDGAVERVASEVDVYGRFQLRSKDRGATLFHAKGAGGFTSLDAVGDPRSVLALLRAALPRVPFEGAESLQWTDTLPARRYRAWPLRWLADFVDPFRGDDGIEMALDMKKEGGVLVVRGQSRERDASGLPLVRTEAVLGRSLGPLRVEVTVRGRTRVAERVGGES
jgi:murein DD-endopeptidase MepM/ murein hydrolase activator NlpD